MFEGCGGVWEEEPSEGGFNQHWPSARPLVTLKALFSCAISHDWQANTWSLSCQNLLLCFLPASKLFGSLLCKLKCCSSHKVHFGVFQRVTCRFELQVMLRLPTASTGWTTEDKTTLSHELRSDNSKILTKYNRRCFNSKAKICISSKISSSDIYENCGILFAVKAGCCCIIFFSFVCTYSTVSSFVQKIILHLHSN